MLEQIRKQLQKRARMRDCAILSEIAEGIDIYQIRNNPKNIKVKFKTRKYMKHTYQIDIIEHCLIPSPNELMAILVCIHSIGGTSNNAQGGKKRHELARI
jgi:hypothetical protein